MGKGDAEKVLAGAGELLGPNNAMIESLDIFPSVTLLSLGLLSETAEGNDVVADDDETTGVADTKSLNSELRPSKSWAEELVGTFETAGAGAANEDDEDISNPNKSEAKELLADLVTELVTCC